MSQEISVAKFDEHSQSRLRVDPFAPLKLGSVELKNRFVRAASNENMSRNGLPTAALIDYHRRLAEGGLGLTSVAYIAVSEIGRTLPDQLWMRQSAMPYFQKLTQAVHEAGGKIAAQITHGGAFVTSLKVKGRTLSSSSGINVAGMMAGNFFKRAMNETDMKQVIAEFVKTAELAVECGFDAVEIHMGHGYLLNQFISPLSNKRKDHYGGSAENRVRFPAAVLAAVKQAVGDKIAVLAKMNVADGVKGGATAEDGIVTAKKLQQAGADMLILSGGRNVESLPFMFGSNMNMAAFKQVLQGQWLTLKAIEMNHKAAKPIAFKEMYFWEYSTKIRQAVPGLPMAFLGGVKSLENVQRALDAGFDAVALSRVLFHDPGFVAKLKSGELKTSGCDNCNACIAYIYHPDGTRCIYNPPNDPELNKQPVAL